MNESYFQNLSIPCCANCGTVLDQRERSQIIGTTLRIEQSDLVWNHSNKGTVDSIYTDSSQTNKILHLQLTIHDLQVHQLLRVIHEFCGDEVRMW